MPDLSVTDCLWYLSLIGRGQAALNKKESIEEGLKNEESFFNNTEPWRSVEDRNLFGTKNLRVKLAGLGLATTSTVVL